jgi:predicted YcjX-like family ATPase
VNNEWTQEAEAEHRARLLENWQEVEAERDAQRCADEERTDALSRVFAEFRNVFGKGGLSE